MSLCKQSTARVRVFSFTGLSLTVLSCTISKNGGAFAALSGGAGALTNITGNFYALALSTTDTNTLGDLAYKFSDSILGVVTPNDANFDQVTTALPGEKVAVTLAASDTSGTLAVTLTAAGADAVSIEAGSPTLNLRQALALITAFAAGKLTGVDTNAPVFDAAGATGTHRITSAVDATGRTSITLNPPA